MPELLSRRLKVTDSCVAFAPVPDFPLGADSDVAVGTKAPMPGKVLAVPVALGQRIHEGQTLVVIEAMKMEHSLSAAKGGVVKDILVQEGEQVSGGDVLIVLDEAEEP